MAAFAEELIHDVRARHGQSRLRCRSDASPRLTASLSADPTSAPTSSRRSCGARGRLLPADVWPNLRVLSCWKGGTMPLYLRKLPELYGDVPIRDLGYMASEGRGATPLVNSGAGGVLNLTSHFFEFVPEEERDEPEPRVPHRATSSSPNREYYVYFTTSAGSIATTSTTSSGSSTSTATRRSSSSCARARGSARSPARS